MADPDRRPARVGGRALDHLRCCAGSLRYRRRSTRCGRGDRRRRSPVRRGRAPTRSRWIRPGPARGLRSLLPQRVVAQLEESHVAGVELSGRDAPTDADGQLSLDGLEDEDGSNLATGPGIALETATLERSATRSSTSVAGVCTPPVRPTRSCSIASKPRTTFQPSCSSPMRQHPPPQRPTRSHRHRLRRRTERTTRAPQACTHATRSKPRSSWRAPAPERSARPSRGTVGSRRERSPGPRQVQIHGFSSSPPIQPDLILTECSWTP